MLNIIMSFDFEYLTFLLGSMQNFLYNYYWLLWYFNIEFQARPYVVRAEIFEYYSYEC